MLEPKQNCAPSSVATLLDELDRLAPLADAAEWDNVGLIAGQPEWPATRVLTSIDLTDAVADEVLRGGFDCVLAYHPPIFKGTRRIAPGAEASTRRLAELLAARVSLLAIHTALDAAVGGTNDVLLDCFELARRYPLDAQPASESLCKLVVFVPGDALERLRSELARAGAGQIGHYAECSFELQGQGTFRGDDSTNPVIGQRGQLERVAEVRLEMLAPQRRLGELVRCIYANHPYEEPAYDIYPLSTLAGRGQVGLGRVGVLAQPQPGSELVKRLQPHVDLSNARIVGDLRRTFSSVIAAAGAFGVRRFRDPAALVLTGEFKHHDALELLKHDICAIHLGHDASERPALGALSMRLAAQLPAVKFTAAQADRSPFRPLDLNA